MDFKRKKHRCFLSLSTSIKRCTKNIQGESLICDYHLGTKMCNFNEEKDITLYNGCVCTFKDKKTINSVKNKPIYLYQKYNKDFLKFPIEEYKLNKECKLIKAGSSSVIIKNILKQEIKGLNTEEKIISFFNKINGKKNINKKLTKTHGLLRARHFFGVFCYYKRNSDKIIRLQKLHRKQKKDKFYKEKYKNSEKIIKDIQVFYRYKIRKRKLPVKPLRMKYFREKKSISKIVFLQNKFKKYIKYKTEHSHNCPYSLEEYKDIPNKYRVCYKYKEGKYTHWRYYHIKWLHNDFSKQTEYKRFVRDPITKKEFNESFIEKVAQKVWYLTRENNDYSLDYDGKMDKKYDKSMDWKNSHKRRSYYSFVLLFYDFSNLLGIDIKNIKKIYNLRNEKNKQKFFYFSIETLNIINNTLLLYNIYDYRQYIREIWNTIVSPSYNLVSNSQEKISDVSCSLNIYSIYSLLKTLKVYFYKEILEEKVLNCYNKFFGELNCK